MRSNFSWSFSWSASILAGVLAVMAGCSSASDKNPGSSGDGPAAKSTGQAGQPVISTENPPAPAKPFETLPSTPDSFEMPVPTTPVRPYQEPVILQPAEPDVPADEPAKKEPAKTKPDKAEPDKTAPATDEKKEPDKKDSTKKDSDKKDSAKKDSTKKDSAKKDSTKKDSTKTEKSKAPNETDDLIPAVPKKSE